MLPWIGDKKNKIAVVGDLILDEYLDGIVDRISPEAPVPVHLVKKSYKTPGGAANSARNVFYAGAAVQLIGIVGCDPAAAEFKNILIDDGIDVSGIVEDSSWTTVRKVRIVSGRQQLLRVDWEKDADISSDSVKQIIKNFERSDAKALLISDYGKGSLPDYLIKNLCELAAAKGLICIVDPKGYDYHKYSGCNLITPNLKEAKEALGISLSDNSQSPKDVAKMLQKKYRLNDILITLGAQGMFYCPKDPSKEMIFKKSCVREVFDVSGAGDTVSAIMTLSLAVRAPVAKALTLANLAAGIVVEKWGTHPVKQDEIESAYKQEKEAQKRKSGFSFANKIVSDFELPKLRSFLKKSKNSIVFTNGCFDIFHAGHADYLVKAKELADILIVGVNTDNSVRKLKGSLRPIHSLENRLKVLSSLACVDYLIPFSEPNPYRLITEISPHVLVKGADYKEHEIIGADWVVCRGGVVKTIPLVEGLSTTNIVESMGAR